MANIIAGIVDTQEAADRAAASLVEQGFARADVSAFYLNPPGMHDTYPIGGDAHHDAGTKAAGKTAAAGAAVGGVTGLAVGTAVALAADSGLATVGAIAGAGVGAYVGSLAGGLSGTEHGRMRDASIEEPAERHAGIVVAVRAEGEQAERKAIETLRASGVRNLERAEGLWTPGADPAWTDFDPRTSPQRI